MKIVPSEFSNSAWNCFILAKEIAYKNHQQDVDSDNLLLALIKEDNFTKKILKKNNVNIKEFEKEIMSSLNSKAKMKNKQDNLYIGDALYKIFLKANDIKNDNTKKVILFSPCAASFDQFKNFEDRGKFFNKITKALFKKKLEYE